MPYMLSLRRELSTAAELLLQIRNEVLLARKVDIFHFLNCANQYLQNINFMSYKRISSSLDSVSLLKASGEADDPSLSLPMSPSLSVTFPSSTYSC